MATTVQPLDLASKHCQRYKYKTYIGDIRAPALARVGEPWGELILKQGPGSQHIEAETIWPAFFG